MIELTFSEYDKIVSEFETIQQSGEVKPFWPTTQQIDMFYLNPAKWIYYICYLYETNPEPRTPAQKYSKKNMQAFINDHLTLVDDDP